MTLIIVSQVSDNPRIDLENLLVMQSYNIFGFSFVFVIYAVKNVIKVHLRSVRCRLGI